MGMNTEMEAESGVDMEMAGVADMNMNTAGVTDMKERKETEVEADVGMGILAGLDLVIFLCVTRTGMMINM